MFEFDTEQYKDYGCEINSSIFQLNFPGTHGWYWFTSIPDNEIKTSLDNPISLFFQLLYQ